MVIIDNYLDGFVQTRGGEDGVVLGVNDQLHDIVLVVDEGVDTGEVLVEVEDLIILIANKFEIKKSCYLNGGVVRGGEDEGLRRVHHDVPQVVLVRLEGPDLRISGFSKETFSLVL